MTDKLFDSFIKNKLEHYESDVPSDLWNKIEQKKDRKPIAFWWTNKSLLVIGIATVFAIGFGFLIAKNQNTFSEKSIATIEQASKNNIAKQLEQTNSSNNQTNQSNTNKVEISNNYSENSSRAAEIHAKSIQSDMNVKIAKIESDNGYISNEKDQVNFSKNINSEKVIKNNVNTKNNKNLSNMYIENISSNRILDKNFFTKSNSKGLKEKHTLKTNITKQAQNINNANELFERNYKTTNFETQTRNFLLLSNNGLTNKDVKINLGNLFGNSDDCPSAKGKTRNDFFIEAYASPDFTTKTITDSKSGLDAYLNKKDSVEVLKFGFTIGARFSKTINNNLLIKAGIQYSQINEEFQLRTENERRQTIVINTKTITRPGMSDTTVSDTSVKVEVGYRVQNNMNYYRNIELPLMISYEFGGDKNWKFALSGGAVINLTSWYEGRTLDASFKTVSLNTKSNGSFYQQKIGLNLYGGLSIIRRINDKLEIFAEPYYRLSLNKIESKEGFKQKFNAMGIQFGTRIRLSKFERLF